MDITLKRGWRKVLWCLAVGWAWSQHSDRHSLISETCKENTKTRLFIFSRANETKKTHEGQTMLSGGDTWHMRVTPLLSQWGFSSHSKYLSTLSLTVASNRIWGTAMGFEVKSKLLPAGAPHLRAPSHVTALLPQVPAKWPNILNTKLLSLWWQISWNFEGNWEELILWMLQPKILKVVVLERALLYFFF